MKELKELVEKGLTRVAKRNAFQRTPSTSARPGSQGKDMTRRNKCAVYVLLVGHNIGVANYNSQG